MPLSVPTAPCTIVHWPEAAAAVVIARANAIARVLAIATLPGPPLIVN